MDNYRYYKSREDAGRVLAKEIGKLNLSNPYLLAIPRGGIQVAEGIADKFKIPVNVIVTKKLPTPDSPETGFGAITEDGHKVINQTYFDYLKLSDSKFNEICQEVIQEIKKRVQDYGSYDKENIDKYDVIVVDDGAATGYSLLAALINIKSYNPKSLTAAIPVSSESAFQEIKKYADNVVCPIVDTSGFFAVGYFYQEFFNLPKQEIQMILQKYRELYG